MGDQPFSNRREPTRCSRNKRECSQQEIPPQEIKSSRPSTIVLTMRRDFVRASGASPRERLVLRRIAGLGRKSLGESIVRNLRPMHMTQTQHSPQKYCKRLKKIFFPPPNSFLENFAQIKKCIPRASPLFPLWLLNSFVQRWWEL